MPLRTRQSKENMWTLPGPDLSLGPAIFGECSGGGGSSSYTPFSRHRRKNLNELDKHSI
jgi:hypothetical protein